MKYGANIKRENKRKIKIKNKINDKREEEKNLVFLMIKIFCKSKHKSKHKNDNLFKLCNECMELFDYAACRIYECKFMETKTFCSICPLHCYKKDMRKRIREVMIFSGKRMLFYRPKLALKHLFITLKTKNEFKKQIKK